MTETIRVDLQELTLAELAELGDLLAPVPLTEMLAGPHQAKAIAAIVAVIKRRTEPNYSLEDAMALRMGDIEFVQQPVGNGQGATDGEMQPASLAPGDSIPNV